MSNIANLAVQLTLQTAAFTGNMTKAQRSLMDLGKAAGQIGRQLTRFGLVINASIVAGLTLAAKAGAQFEASMARVDAITQATEVQFNALSRAARDMGEQTIFTAVQAAEALREFAQAGFSVRESLIALKPTLDFAVAGNIQIAEAADIAARILRGLGLEAGDLAQSLDVLTKAFTKAPVTVQELGEAFKFVGPVGRAAGKDIQELTAVLTVFARAGLRGEQAGTALRNILLRLQAQPTEVRKALEQLGITVADETGNLKELATVFEEVRLATARMTNVERQAIISRIAGIRATAAFSAAMQAGAAQIRELDREFSVVGNTMQRIADRQLETLSAKFLLLKSAVTESLLTINDRFGPSLKELIELGTRTTKMFTKWIDENETLFKGLVVTAGIIGTLALGLGAIGTTLAVVIPAYVSFKIALLLGAGAMATSLVVAGAFVIVLGAVSVALFLGAKRFQEWRVGLTEANKRLEELRVTEEKIIKQQELLSKLTKSQITLQQKLTAAQKENRSGDAVKLELALQQSLVDQAAIRVQRTKDLIAQRRRTNTLQGGENKLLQGAVDSLGKAMLIRDGIGRRLKSAVASQKEMEDAIAGAILRAQQLAATQKTSALLDGERLSVLSKTNNLAFRRLQIIENQNKLIAVQQKMLKKSGLSVEEQAQRAKAFQNQLKTFTAERLALLEMERNMRVKSFVSTERQLAFLRLRAQRDEILSAAATALEVINIEKAFQRKKAALIEKFRKEDEKNQVPDIQAQPGAFRQGTIEAFKAAFGKNPLLDETKKQTEEQKKQGTTLKAIEKNTEAEQIGQAVINVG